MKKLFAVLLAALMLMCVMSGCKDAPQTPATDTDPTVTTQSVQTGTGELQTAVADETDPAQFANVYSYGSDEIESYYFWNDCDMEMVQILAITTEDALEYTAIGVEMEFPLVRVGEAIRLDVMIPEGLPVNAIAYTANGKYYQYVLGYDGRDGGAALMETELVMDLASGGTSSQKATFEIYLVNDNADGLNCCEMTVASDSEFDVWDTVKQLNPCIPAATVLNSFTIDGTLGTLDVSADILSANVGSGSELLMLQAIANTYIEGFGVSEIMITVDGGVYESGHIILDENFVYNDTILQ